MKREARLLLTKAIDSLLLSAELFNRPFDRGRVTGTFIMLDHSFEMLLKASIVDRGGSIWSKRDKMTLGFDATVRKGLTDGSLKFLTEDQALTLQAINGLRDAAQHHLLEVSESTFYYLAQTGITLFRDILFDVFAQQLRDHLPDRVLPISTTSPTDVITLFDKEVEEIRKLLGPGKRRKIEVQARLRPLMILDGTLAGVKGQPSEKELTRLAQSMRKGASWMDLFPGIAAVQFTTTGQGSEISLRITKKEGTPVQLVPEGTPGAYVVATKRVNELDYYSLNVTAVAEKVGLTRPKTLAIIRCLGIQEDKVFFKEFLIGKQRHKRYAPSVVERIRQETEKPEFDIDEVFSQYGPKRKAKTR